MRCNPDENHDPIETHNEPHQLQIVRFLPDPIMQETLPSPTVQGRHIEDPIDYFPVSA